MVVLRFFCVMAGHGRCQLQWSVVVTECVEPRDSIPLSSLDVRADRLLFTLATSERARNFRRLSVSVKRAVN